MTKTVSSFAFILDDLQFNHCVIAKSYLKSFLIIDLVTLFPFSLSVFLTLELECHSNFFMNVFRARLACSPIFYKFLMTLRLIRLRHVEKAITDIFKKLKISFAIQIIASIIYRMTVIIHFIASFFACVASLSSDHSTNWLIN